MSQMPDTLTTDIPLQITKLTYYLHWLSLPHKPTFEQQHWLDSTTLLLLTDDTPYHFSYAMIDPNNATPYISDDWLICQ